MEVCRKFSFMRQIHLEFVSLMLKSPELAWHSFRVTPGDNS